MATVIIDGRVRVSILTSVANKNAPTVAECNAGIAVEQYINPDGLDVSNDTGGVNVSNLRSTFTTMRAGRRKPTASVTAHHDSPTDVLFDLLPYRATGYMVIRRGIDAATAWTAGQRCEVYPYEAGECTEKKPEPDGTWDFTVPMFVSEDPATRAVVAA